MMGDINPDFLQGLNGERIHSRGTGASALDSNLGSQNFSGQTLGYLAPSGVGDAQEQNVHNATSALELGMKNRSRNQNATRTREMRTGTSTNGPITVANDAP